MTGATSKCICGVQPPENDLTTIFVCYFLHVRSSVFSDCAKQGTFNSIQNFFCCPSSSNYLLDQFTKTFFWNFQSIQADLCYILIYKQMLEKVFCSNIAPSLSSGNHLFYKAEYMGRSCPNQVWTITFDWSALAT